MRFRALLVGCVCALVALAPASALAKTSHKHKHKQKVIPTYYVALGDSLAQGAQPLLTSTLTPRPTAATNQGYADDLYASLKKHNRKLKLQKFGCLGETTASMLLGKAATPPSPCSYGAKSQLAQAVKFMKSHRIALVTLDIGANDIDNCAKNGAIDFSCLSTGIASIKTNLPTILAALRKAGPKVKMAGMTYYDPFLAAYLSNSYGQLLAEASVPLAKSVNDILVADFTAKRFKVADVATEFFTYDTTSTATLPGFGTVPKSVATLCTWTWNCTPAPVGPNIHANKTGYAEIAAEFAAVL